MTEKKCSKCGIYDSEFPHTLYGETGKIIKYKGKIICYNCWCMIKYGSGA